MINVNITLPLISVYGKMHKSYLNRLHIWFLAFLNQYMFVIYQSLTGVRILCRNWFLLRSPNCNNKSQSAITMNTRLFTFDCYVNIPFLYNWYSYLYLIQYRLTLYNLFATIHSSRVIRFYMNVNVRIEFCSRNNIN